MAIKMRFQVYKDKHKEYRWRAIARNNKIVADSGESYKRKHAAHKAVIKFKLRAMYSPVEVI